MAIFGDFLHPVLSASCVQQVSDLHLKFADIQSAAAEIRRGKKEERTNYSMKIQRSVPFHRVTINITA